MTLILPQRGRLSTASGGAWDVSYITTAASSADTSTWTFSSQSFGTADSNRYVVVTYGGLANIGASNPTFSSATIGGVSASSTAIRNANNSSNNPFTGILYAAVPTGTTGDVVITFNGALAGVSIAIYRVVVAGTLSVNASTTERNTETVNIILNTTISTVVGAPVFAVAATRNGLDTFVPLNADFTQDASNDCNSSEWVTHYSDIAANGTTENVGTECVGDNFAGNDLCGSAASFTV